ncbi:hypothetical protein GCM10022399_16730 [Terrabacter ginsenosidimutans]|uniref:Uncharacterized protein n=1 Tax=Terrabacter ginsenosidimutans TaxID=490575 RepID=A0ABP7D4U8_9MICO
MTASTSTDPAVTELGRGALPGRRAHSRTPVGGGDRIGAGSLVGGWAAPIQPSPVGQCAGVSGLANGIIGAGRGR